MPRSTITQPKYEEPDVPQSTAKPTYKIHYAYKTTRKIKDSDLQNIDNVIGPYTKKEDAKEDRQDEKQHVYSDTARISAELDRLAPKNIPGGAQYAQRMREQEYFKPSDMRSEFCTNPLHDEVIRMSSQPAVTSPRTGDYPLTRDQEAPIVVTTQ